MVQRKAPKRLSPQAKSMEKQPHPNPEKPLPSHHLQQDTKKKMMKELRSITISDIDGGGFVHHHLNKKNNHPSSSSSSAAKKRDLLPNYMKPTTSSDARKELPKVTTTHESPKSLKKKKKKKPIIRPQVKRRNIGVLVCSSMHVNRATCSSTLKDSKFPKALQLRPGATEAQGTSAIKVCPYTYCSLNGHVHRDEGLHPPLKCFLASRRKLMRSQKSFRLKGVAQFRKMGSLEEMATGQSIGLKIAPLTHAKEVDDFFVEIYAEPKTNAMEKEGFDRSSFREEEVNSTSVVDLADDEDRCSDSSVEEMDETTKFLEYVSCDQSCKGEGGNPPDLVSKDCVIEESEKYSEDRVGSEANLPDLKPSDVDSVEDADLFPDENESNCYQISDDGLAQVRESSFQNDELNIGLLFEMESNLDPCGMVECGAEISHETSDARADCGKEISTIDDPSESEDVEIQNQAAHFPCAKVGEEENISNMVCEEKINAEEARIEQVSSFPEQEIISSAISEGDEAYQKVNFEASSSSDSQVSNQIEANSNIEEDTDAEPEEKEAKQISEHAAEEPNFVPETQNFSFGTHEDEASEEGGGSSESDINEILQFQDKEECEVDDICVAFSAMSLGEDESMDSTTEFSKNRYIIARRRTTQDSEYVREFNPRSPRFLPFEPDPEAEKVDLRHQMTDERKNAEEWMIDYALQKAVNKLAPARKKKVELLVEAFEAVIPIPACEKSMQNETTRFRPIQACN